MRTLIIEDKPDLAKIWTAHLVRQGMHVSHAATKPCAMTLLSEQEFDVILLDADIDGGRPFALADYIAYRLPKARIVFVTGTSFFSDVSVFSLASNAHACVPADSKPADIVSLVDYHARAAQDDPNRNDRKTH
ncbi:response regulator [Aliiroseovarius sp. F20344]|uniref:response regulator n=1 Tax=Aliiroseovarius sp. F20344 TaxID=2926414 RepID=UPI001FF52432|nr:response regulator [Aliiroseovarius sp. F20344]MCK0141001.1 response regulator [Aliiroseovarius sp. F20344]